MDELIRELYSNRKNVRESVFKKRFETHYKNICEIEFPNEFTFPQKIYHYIHNDYDLKLGICNCGNRCKFKNFKEGYYKHCSNKCSQKDDSTRNKRISTNIIKYGVDNPAKNEDVKFKQIKTNNERYGFNSPSCVKDINDLQKMSSYKTKKERHTFNTSKSEDLFYQYLVSNGYSCERQYKSDLYPFNCDFYINTYDLYIEIQGNWTHGGDTSLNTHPHPYDSNCVDDIKQVNLWENKSKLSKYYKGALYNWTVRDVNKRNVAQRNNLNYLEIFSYDINTIVGVFEDYLKMKK